MAKCMPNATTFITSWVRIVLIGSLNKLPFLRDWHYMSATQLIGDKIFAFCLLANNGGLSNIYFFINNLPLIGLFYNSPMLLPSYNVCHVYHFTLHYIITLHIGEGLKTSFCLVAFLSLHVKIPRDKQKYIYIYKYLS